MFQPPATVQLSAPAFSFLLYETCKADWRQEGFLLGEIIHKENISITDNDQRQIDISKVIKVNSVMPIPQGSQFFLKGRVEKEKVRKFLGGNFEKVVAWYRYQPQSSQLYFQFTLKEKAIHKQLRELFEKTPQLFVCCFMSMDATGNQSTFSYTQNFQRYYNGVYDRLSIVIPNLSESNHTYKNSEPATYSFNKVLSSANVNIQNAKGIVAITEIENVVQKHINETVLELAKTEQYLFQLENEVEQLRRNGPEVNVESDPDETPSQNKLSVDEEDLISFDEDPPVSPKINTISYASKVSQNNQKLETSPVFQKKMHNRNKMRRKSESNDKASQETEADSNRKESEIEKESETPINALEIHQRRGRGSINRAKRGVTPVES